MSQSKILIIGAGVSGLSTGIKLFQAGYPNHIWAKDLSPNTTSDVAAAFWYPYSASPKDKVTKWSKATLAYLNESLIQLPETGCVAKTVHEYFDHKVGDPWWREAVEHFRRLKPAEIPEGYVDGYSVESVLMDSSKYMKWLMDEYNRLGGKITQKTVKSLDEAQADHNIVINCTGLGARELCNDNELYPIRGQVVKVKPTGFDLVICDDDGPNGLLYVVPRKNDVVLGGTEQQNDWNLDVSEQDTQDILRKAGYFSDAFKNPEIFEIRVGLRPARKVIRLEKESVGQKNIIHNYGHGGSGFTLSWGCADEVVNLVNSI